MPNTDEHNETPFLGHLIELRSRLLRIVAVLAVIFLALFAFSQEIYQNLAQPLMQHLPAGNQMIATNITSTFLTPLKLTFVVAIFIAIPYLFFELWGFIAPGLYQHEKRWIFPLLLASTFLFYSGAAFAYFVVFPLIFAFFVSAAPTGIAVMPDIAHYLDFTLRMFFAFGLAFEVPIAIIVLTATGIADVDKLKNKRPYIIVGAFVIGMLLTPPDVISQVLLAVPIWLLFEIGLIFAKFLAKPSTAQSI